MPLFTTAVLVCLSASLTARAEPTDRMIPSGLNQRVVSDHFVVHFTTTGPSAVSESAASSVVSSAEQTYAIEVGAWGWPAPLNDGDGKTDIYVGEFGIVGGAGVEPDASTAQQSRASAYMVLSPPTLSILDWLMPHELMHILVWGVFFDSAAFADPSPAFDYFAGLFSNWAPRRATGVYDPPAFMLVPQLSLDCTTSTCDEWHDAQYAFLEFLADKFGPHISVEVWEAARSFGANAGMTPAIDRALQQHGTSLSEIFNAYTAANVSLSYVRAARSFSAYRGFRRFQAHITGRHKTILLRIDHLAANFIAFGNSSRRRCGSARLSLRIVLPASSTAKPTFLIRTGSTQHLTKLHVAGRVATLVAPWRTCRGTSGILGVPNPSLTADVQPYIVSASVKNLR